MLKCAKSEAEKTAIKTTLKLFRRDFDSCKPAFIESSTVKIGQHESFVLTNVCNTNININILGVMSMDYGWDADKQEKEHLSR